MNELNFEFQRIDEVTGTLLIEGTINTQTALDLEKKIQELQGDNITHLILDMVGVKYVNSTGVGTLINIADALIKNPNGKPGNLALIQLPAKIKVIFDMLQLNNLVKIFPSQNDALKYFREGSESENKSFTYYPVTNKLVNSEMNSSKASVGDTLIHPTLRPLSLPAERPSISHDHKHKTSIHFSGLDSMAKMASNLGAPIGNASIPANAVQPSSSILNTNEMKMESQQPMTKHDLQKHLTQCCKLIDIFLDKIDFDTDELEQIQEVLHEIGKVIIEKTKPHQLLNYNFITNPEYTEIRFRITGDK
ncbi:MAG: STAS domain-containing protein [Planctomycetes bacterium]|jgi:anti-anti-sigma factor|nr:STAS domain-containing protein [Planctomycetota bacterium]HNZ66363.1 STAS domain-containing protein [Planctomycetota bacterium]HPY74761.1 STAS domain-containing protein [Planctomycetota bacterium]HQB00402.1 STAS domain-containing protein [Planctomycetota bacterium]